MARTVKEEEYTTRRNEILASAQKLVLTRGYENMSIQDILDDLHISKGAFYHYFDTKHDLLEAIVFQRMEGVQAVIRSIIENDSLSAVEKLQAYFSGASDFKLSQKPFLMDLLNIWYNDDNAIVRQKIMARSIIEVTHWMNKIIQMGIEEGSFHVGYPRQVSEVLLSISLTFGEGIITKLIAYNRQPGNPQELIDSIGAYNEAIERLLGMEQGTLHVVNFGMIKEWMVPASEKLEQAG